MNTGIDGDIPETWSPQTVLMTDARAVHELAQSVGWPHKLSDIELLIELGHGVKFCPVDHDVPLAVGMWWSHGARHASLGMIIVHPEAQRRGLGWRVLNWLVDACADRSITLVATAAGKPLYQRAGFRPVGEIAQHQGILAAGMGEKPPKNHGIRIRDASLVDLPLLCRLDMAGLGVDREIMIRTLLRRGRAVIAEGSYGPIGYGLERQSGHGQVVGPIIASDETVAKQLFHALAVPGFVRVDHIGRKGPFADALRKAGLLPVDELAVMMVRGNEPRPCGSGRQFALASQALG